jgi:hypothetical protein
LICEQKDGERVTGRTSTKVLTGELKVRENNHEPIISEEVFQKVARQFEARSQKFSSGSSRNLPMEEDIYKDLIYCGLCGSKFTRECGLTNRSGGKVRNYHYRCVNKETIDDRKCDNDRISLIILNRLVEEALEKEFSLASMKRRCAKEKWAEERKERKAGLVDHVLQEVLRNDTERIEKRLEGLQWSAESLAALIQVRIQDAWMVRDAQANAGAVMTDDDTKVLNDLTRALKGVADVMRDVYAIPTIKEGIDLERWEREKESSGHGAEALGGVIYLPEVEGEVG